MFKHLPMTLVFLFLSVTLMSFTLPPDDAADSCENDCEAYATFFTASAACESITDCPDNCDMMTSGTSSTDYDFWCRCSSASIPSDWGGCTAKRRITSGIFGTNVFVECRQILLMDDECCPPERPNCEGRPIGLTFVTCSCDADYGGSGTVPIPD